MLLLFNNFDKDFFLRLFNNLFIFDVNLNINNLSCCDFLVIIFLNYLPNHFPFFNSHRLRQNSHRLNGDWIVVVVVNYIDSWRRDGLRLG